MESSSPSFTFFACVFIFSFFPLPPICSTLPSHPFPAPKCHGYERSALLEFKHSLTIINSASSSIDSYPKVFSWKSEGAKGDCCSWDGVQCDEKTGHVVALDLSSSCLYGSVNSSNSLFRLVHLQILNLADNDFDFSEIPSGMGSLMELRSLNLSASTFSGEIPGEISKLKKLVLLDLSWNYLLQKSSLQFLIQNMDSIEILDLSLVNISSEIPAILSNFTSLKSLSLRDCQLNGQIPEEIFHLPKLRRLNLMYNENITGILPHFPKNSSLQVMWLAATGLSGELPSSIGNLGSLLDLDLYGCKFSGSIPTELGKLTHLLRLQLSFNSFTGQIPLSIGNLVDLRSVMLCNNLLTGQIPSVFTNVYNLQELSLCGNNFTGPFPSSLANLYRLVHLDLSDNHFYGSISKSVFSLKNLAYLDLSHNIFTGSVDFEEFNALKNLTVLNLSGNQLSLVVDDSSNNASSSTSVHKFQHLGLSQCNLRKVPAFLRNQNELKWLDLSNNSIHGGIPEWMLNIGKETLDYINFSHNFFTGFSSRQVLLPWSRLTYLDLSFNWLQGSIPIPPFSLTYFSVAKNLLTGEISPAICSMTSLFVLDLSYNNFTGAVPPCLSSSSDSLTVLNLRRNKFHGILPQNWKDGSMLQMISFSENNFHGKIPRTLINCARLKILDLSNNKLSDEFPSWLGVLPELKLLNLRSNGFHGEIKNPGRVGHDRFPNLCIIDLACNNFTGKLPLEIINGWKAMKNNSPEDFLAYIEVGTSMSIFQFTLTFSYDYSMAITNKGVQVQYDKLLELFTVIDLSNNALEGEVPEIIGNLTGLRSLNLSHNLFTGDIPSSLGNVKNLESLDLSTNKFSGEIPQNLNQLTFLGFFNVSNNNLAGSIPRGNQFDTFQSSSYEGNYELCGPPLLKRCRNLEGKSGPPWSAEEDRGSESLFEYGWKISLIGYGFGLLMGHFIEFFLNRRKPIGPMRLINYKY